MTERTAETAVTDPPFFAIDGHLMRCGQCGLVMGQTWLLQVAHIGWHERNDEPPSSPESPA